MAKGVNFGGSKGKRLEGNKRTSINSDREITKELVKYAGPYWKPFLLSLFLILLVSSSQLARPYIIKIAIDDYIKRGITGTLTLKQCENGIKVLGIMYFVFMLLELVMSYFQTYILERTAKEIIMNLREKIFTHIQKLPISYFDKKPIGKIVTRATNDTDSLNDMFTDVIIGFIQNLFIMVGILFVMISLDLKLTLICLLATPLMFIVTLLFKKKARKIFSDIRNKLSLINSFMSENIAGMKIIQIFNMENKKYREFEDINKEYYNANLKQIALFGIFRPFMDVVKTLSLALILAYGGIRLVKGTIEVGTIYAFINYINRLFQPIIELTDQYNTYQSSMVSAERIFSILNEEVEEDREDACELDKLAGEIEFRNVWFAYEEENWILKDISFKIFPGQAVSFVGATGAGKTSVTNLICGFYEHQKGEILIDGIDIKHIKKKVLRKNIGLVLQDVFLFAGDIETNIRLFNKDISLEEVKSAAEYINADYFIEAFNDGYKHKINEKGTTLSMGQRQLISFARALVFNPAILVMDEATSNIDTETEFLIQEALGKLMKGRTTIAVAHRLSTVKKSDKVIVLHKGEVKEMGNHEDLMRKKGFYYKLYKQV
ncbi:ABC transporter ATP-binding protein [Clostridium thailandense]|uniref:ABC transporter ATP-binding protein n=1 Tax=Clostridium thailandense TaxID=2794346 RepID=UPI003989BD7B